MTEKIKSINPKTLRIVQTVLLILVAVLSRLWRAPLC